MDAKFGVAIEVPKAQDWAQKIQSDPDITSSIQDDLILLFQSRKYEDLDGYDKLVFLKKEISAIVNKRTFKKGEGRVTEVRILEFIIQ